MLKRLLSRVSAVALAFTLIVAAFALTTRPAQAGDDHYREGGGGNRGSSGVNIGIGVGTIILNEALRQRQQKLQQQQTNEPRGCPDGFTWSKKKHDCIKLASPCEPPKIKTKKGCVYPGTTPVSCKWPEVKSGKECDCAAGYYREHGECVKKPDVASCEFPEVKSGKGCDCAKGYYRHDGECVKKDDVVSCYWPKIRFGDGCVCAPGFVSAAGTCTKVVVVAPVPDEPEEPPYVAPVAPKPPKQVEQPAPKPNEQPKVAAIGPIVDRCLPQDLHDLLVETYGKRPGIGPCPSACLPKPVYFTPTRLDAIASKSGITWCENCLQVGPYMPLASIQRLEALGGLTICVAPDSCVYPGGAAGGVRTEIRTVFKDLPAGAKNEDNLAVVVGNEKYGEGIPANLYGDSDADAVTALLIDQLGYRKENIIDLRDASLADLERVFGSEQNPGGEIAKRIDKQDPGDVFIYVASHGMVKEEDTKQVYLLPVDAKLDQLDTTAYPIQELYDNLGKTGARTTMLVLEANFAKNLDELIDPPNLPELDVEAMPLAPVPGLAVFKASDRDQRAIQDPEYGIGLFTRYLIEGLAGRADEAPLGNGDRRIDTVELYVYTADTVRTAARKSFGLEQKPMLSKIDNLVVGNLAAN